MSTFFSRLWNMGSCCTGRSNKLARDAERARETLEDKKLEDEMRQDVENELQQQRKMGQMALGVQGRVQVSQIMNGAQPALTKQQLNEQIQNLNKLLASPDRKHRNEEIFQLLKTINRSAHKHNDKPIIKFYESGSECYAILDNLLNDELLSDEDGNKDRCVFCTSAGTTHYLNMSKLCNVRIVSPLETKLYCVPHDIKTFEEATGTSDGIRSNRKLKVITSKIPVYTNNGRGESYMREEFQPVHEFKDGSKFIAGIKFYDPNKITSCPGIAYNELQAHPESLQINHCNGYTENDYREKWYGGHYPKYYTGNSATDPDRGFYFMNNNMELVKCGDFPKDFKFRHDELNELFGLGEYAQQAAAGLDDIIEINDADLETAMKEAGILPPDQQAQQPVVNSDSDSDLPAEAQIQGDRPTEVEDSVIEAQPAQQPAEAPVIEEEPVAKPAEEPAAEEPAADEPVANNNAQPAQPAQPAAAAPQQAADEQPTIIKSNRDAEIKLYNANGHFRSGSIDVDPGEGHAEVTYANNTKAYIYLQNGARIHRSNSITVKPGDSAEIITPDESTTYAKYKKQTDIHHDGSFDF